MASDAAHGCVYGEDGFLKSVLIDRPNRRSLFNRSRSSFLFSFSRSGENENPCENENEPDLSCFRLRRSHAMLMPIGNDHVCDDSGVARAFQRVKAETSFPTKITGWKARATLAKCAFACLAALAAHAQDYFPPPESAGGWRRAEPAALLIVYAYDHVLGPIGLPREVRDHSYPDIPYENPNLMNFSRQPGWGVGGGAGCDAYGGDRSASPYGTNTLAGSRFIRCVRKGLSGCKSTESPRRSC
jgi:hypothetical protein